MSFASRLLHFAQPWSDDNCFNSYQPWWEVIVGFAIDVAVLVSVTSVTSDLFQGAGALLCVPANKNNVHPYTQHAFIEQECTELWPVYAKYFSYFLTLQCFLLMALRSLWTRGCRHQLRAFAKLVGEIKNSDVTKAKVNTFLSYHRHHLHGRERGDVIHEEDDEKDDDGAVGSSTVEGIVSLRSLQWTDERVLATIGLHDRVRDLPQVLEDLTSSFVMYKRKSIIGVALSVVIIGWGWRKVAQRDFDFYFTCSLNASNHANLLDYYDFVCVNKTTTISYVLQILFCVVVGIQGLAELLGLYQCLRLSCIDFSFSSLSSSSPRSDDDVDAPHGGGGGIPLLNGRESRLEPPRVATKQSIGLPQGRVDAHFLKMLLHNADEEAEQTLVDFVDEKFRDDLEEVVTCLQWPYSKIKGRFKTVDEDDDDEEDKETTNGNSSKNNNSMNNPKKSKSKSLRGRVSLTLADVDLLTIPKALLRTGSWSLVTLDLSFNENLVDLDEEVLAQLSPSLATLKCRNSGVRDVGPICRRLEKLNFLDISFNELCSIKDLNGAANLTELRSLWVVGNPFRGGSGGGGEGGGGGHSDFAPDFFIRLSKLREIRIDRGFMTEGSVGAKAGFKTAKGAPATFKRLEERST